jgi:hypothetical protein
MKHDILIGINDIVKVWPCDIWASMDEPAVKRITPCNPEQVALYTRRRRVRYAEGKYRDVIVYEDIVDVYHTLGGPKITSWGSWTITATIMMAHFYLKVTKLTLYGCDMKGDRYWDGETIYDPNRAQERWSNESVTFAHVCGYLRRQGVRVLRLAA